MPQETTTDTPSLAETATNALAEKTAKALIRAAEERIKKLLTHEKQISELQSNLDILMKRYFVEKSFFDRASDWYGKKPWWNKAFTAVSYIGLSALIGAVFNLTALLTITAVGIYTAAHSLLNHHYTIASARSVRFCADIVEMEQDLKEEVKQLREIEGSLRAILVSLDQEQLRLSEDNAEFEGTVAALRIQTVELTATIEQLGQAKDGLLISSQQLKEQLDSIQHEFKNSQEELRQKTSEIGTLNQQLLDTQSKLAGSDKDLEVIHAQYQERLARLDVLEAVFNEQLVVLAASVQEIRLPTQSKLGEPSEKDAHIISVETQKIIDSANTSLRRGKEEMEAFERLLDDAADKIEDDLLQAAAILTARRSKKDTPINGLKIV